MTAKVKYTVTGPVFVNAIYHDPRGRADYTIEADPGLAGTHLKTDDPRGWPQAAKPVETKAGDAKSGAMPAVDNPGKKATTKE